MGLLSTLKREFTFIKRLGAVLGRVKDVDGASHNLLCDDFEKAVDRFGPNKAILYEAQSITYDVMDAFSNRIAHWARSKGLKVGDTVALLLPNRLEYIAIWMGFNKVGVITALINNSLTGPGLAHCINIAGASVTIVDDSTKAAFLEIEPTLARQQSLWVLDMDQAHETDHQRSLSEALRGVSSVRPDRSLRADLTASTIALYIYTSGTTGLPKAAKISNARAQLYMKAFAGLTRMTPEDRLYNVLPLYHSTGGLCGVGASLLNGASMKLKRKFSASVFWSDISKFGCTHIVYIGELCRYLINSPPSPQIEDEKRHKIRMVFGNGMRPEVWKEFETRFNIPIIVEFYGSTEGNVSLFNFDGYPGAIGRIPKHLKSKFNIRLARFDVESELPERRPDGLCYECKPNEIGEAIGKIGHEARYSYTGYADKAASEKKILRDVFKKGDMWFRTGDLMRQDKHGYFYFIDRIGDTFRFKGENVSTSEVSEACARAQGVDEAIVYGVSVPNYDGKAGMVSLITSQDFDLKLFGEHMKNALPIFARPRFVRLLQEVETTGTFKYKKMDMVNVGFDPSLTMDPLFVLADDGSYQPITEEALKAIQAGTYRL
jgi:fatty-acyl-CoA synthase